MVEKYSKAVSYIFFRARNVISNSKEHFQSKNCTILGTQVIALFMVPFQFPFLFILFSAIKMHLSAWMKCQIRWFTIFIVCGSFKLHRFWLDITWYGVGKRCVGFRATWIYMNTNEFITVGIFPSHVVKMCALKACSTLISFDGCISNNRWCTKKKEENICFFPFLKRKTNKVFKMRQAEHKFHLVVWLPFAYACSVSNRFTNFLSR